MLLHLTDPAATNGDAFPQLANAYGQATEQQCLPDDTKLST